MTEETHNVYRWCWSATAGKPLVPLNKELQHISRLAEAETAPELPFTPLLG